MTYIILRDTFGDGLETISNIGVDVIEEHQLDSEFAKRHINKND